VIAERQLETEGRRIGSPFTINKLLRIDEEFVSPSESAEVNFLRTLSVMARDGRT
jgi:hypothetical protein